MFWCKKKAAIANTASYYSVYTLTFSKTEIAEVSPDYCIYTVTTQQSPQLPLGLNQAIGVSVSILNCVFYA